jgi:uncharacterized protein YeeX (DUF496 family)
MKLKKNKNKIILSLITLLTIFSLAISAFSVGTASIDEQIEELKNIIDSSSKYSDFRKNQILLPKLKELLEEGISFEDTKEIVENSVKKLTDAYDMKDIFDALLETKKKGLFTVSIINKINEGLAKNASKVEIISAISTKAENLKKANEILNEALQEGLEINGEEEMVGILADSLENDVPQESLSWLLKTGTTEGKSIEEISEISEELSYLSLMAYDSGLSPEEISLLFKKATENSSNIGEICENVQTSLDAEISTAKIEEGGTAKPSTTTDNGTLPTSSTGSPTEVGETPTQEAGEAPTETGSAPEPSTSPTEEAPSPPEN